MAGAWGASGPQWGASLTSSQYFPPPANSDQEGNLWADLLKGCLTSWNPFSYSGRFITNVLIAEVAANKLRLAAGQLVRLCRSYYHLLEVVVAFWAQHCFLYPYLYSAHLCFAGSTHTC